MTVGPAMDGRFRGSDPRLLVLADALGVDVGGLDTRTLPDAVADAVDAQGLPAGFGGLLADLLRHYADTRHKPAPLSAAEARRRLLRDALAAWASRAGGRLKQHDAHAKHVRGLEAVFREVARREGAQWQAVRRWCMSDPEALGLVAFLRPVKGPQSPHKPRRGLDRTRPSPEGLPALLRAWR